MAVPVALPALPVGTVSQTDATQRTALPLVVAAALPEWPSDLVVADREQVVVVLAVQGPFVAEAAPHLAQVAWVVPAVLPAPAVPVVGAALPA